MKKVIYSFLFFFSINTNAQQSDSELLALFAKNSVKDFKTYFISEKDNNNILGKIYSANNIYSDFNNNELAAKNKYKDKQLHLKATISKIKDDAFGNVLLSENLDSSSMSSAIFKFMDKDNERFFTLRKGDNVDLTCQFDEFSSFSLSFQKCQFSDQYLEKIFFDVTKNISEFSSESYKPKSKIEGAFAYLLISMQTQILHVCRADSVHCSADKLKKSKFFKKDLTQNSQSPDVYFDNKFGKDWFKSLPKVPEAY